MGVERVAEEAARRLGVARLRLSRRCGGPTGFLVALEGIDGSGLSTQTRLITGALQLILEARGVVASKEPTDGPVGGLIRRLIGPGGGGADQRLLALLYAADRLWHITRGLPCGPLPRCLASGYVVVFDRYKYSSLAYQSSAAAPGAPAPLEWVATVNAYAPPPHILVYVDVDPEVAWERVKSRGRTLELFEDPETLRGLKRSFDNIIAAVEASGDTWGPRLWRSLEGWSGCLETHSMPAVVRVRDPGDRAPEEVALEALEHTLSSTIRLGLVEAVE